MTRYLALLLVACSPSPPATISDGCYNVGSSICARAQSCGSLRDTVGVCTSDFVASCCVGVDCSRPVRSCSGSTTCCATPACDVLAVDVGVFERCQAGVDALTCGQLAAGLVPVGCLPDAG